MPQIDRPDKYLYRLTDAGRAELDTWLAAPFVRQTGYRDDFFLKLLAAARLGGNRLDEVLRIQRDAYLGELASLANLHDDHRDNPLVSLLIDAAIRHTKANLEVVERAEKERAALARRPTKRPGARTPAEAHPESSTG